MRRIGARCAHGNQAEGWDMTSIQTMPTADVSIDDNEQLVTITMDASRFDVRAWKLGNTIAGDHGYGIMFQLRGDRALIRRISGGDPRIVVAPS
jgi:hypothetical protein